MSQQPPLCVDLDGTLLKTDTLHESLLLSFKAQPLIILRFPGWLLRGKAHFKEELTKNVLPDAESLPCNNAVLDYLRSEKEKGRRLILTTGANQKVADALARKLGIFDEVLASNATHNLSGKHKADALREKFGNRSFDYAGNDPVDLEVWAVARNAIVVSDDEKLTEAAKARCHVEKVFVPERKGLKTWLRALRIYQWSKNLLLFVPLLGAHGWHDIGKVQQALLAFFAFSLCASSVYVLNDLLDIEADRHHPTKRKRPFASGSLPLSAGMISVPILLVASIALALMLPLPFVLAFAGYYVTTSLYSFRLKQIVLLDVFVLACLYGLRVLAGAYAVSVPISDWLLIFCIFFFLSLAFVKRFTELQSLQSRDVQAARGRGYVVGDLEPIASMGLASGYVAVLVFTLYVGSPAVVALYNNPRALWLGCPVLLYWISRVWLLAHRGVLHEDPIVFALKDKRSYWVALAVLLIAALAQPKQP